MDKIDLPCSSFAITSVYFGLPFSINKLYNEGLIDPEYATNDTNVWLSRLTNEISGACQDTTARAYSLGTQVRSANEDSEAWFVVVAPPQGPDGTQMTTSQMQPIIVCGIFRIDQTFVIQLIDEFQGFLTSGIRIGISVI